jgi:hypothetical protein
LLVIDLILAKNRRPRAMFLWFLLGGVGVAVAFGLIDVLVLRIDAIKTQNHLNGGIDLGLGIPLLVIGLLLATGHLDLHRGRQGRPGRRAALTHKLGNWIDRMLIEPRFAVAFLVGVASGLPGASYLVALHDLVQRHQSTTLQVVAVCVFVAINFALVIIPFAAYLTRPHRTDAALQRFQHWLGAHNRQIVATVLIVVGAFMVTSGATRLV